MWGNATARRLHMRPGCRQHVFKLQQAELDDVRPA
jgi:hypothetical protein